MNRKAKGTNAERELVQFFNENGWSCVRIAGSGCSKYPAPDVLAGNAVRRLAIECKTTKGQKKYFQPEEIEQLDTFSRKFGAESWIGVKFSGEPWYFLMLEDLENTGSCEAISIRLAKRKGLKIEELLQKSNENQKV